MIDIVFILIVTAAFILESEPSLQQYFNIKPIASGPVNPIAFWVFGINGLATIWFTSDILMRMASWPNFFKYWKNFMNILDIVSVLPFYISLIEWGSPHRESQYLILKALRLSRVVRVFKFVRHSQSMMVILKAVAKARHELIVLFISMFLFVVTFGAIMFYLEGEVVYAPGMGPATPFSSIATSCWWVLVSITTVGFGDMYPTTILGKMIGSLVLFLGIICLALPMTIIVTKFSIEFDREKS